MSGSTTELALKTAVDSDDTADYLTLSLADSLRTVDALYNNVTGHTHSGAHQGGPIGSIPASAIAPGSITSAMIADGTITSADIADGTIQTIDLAPNSVTQLIASYINTPSFTTSTTGVAVATPVTATGVSGGGLLRLDCSTVYGTSVLGNQHYWGFGLDGAAPSGWFALIYAPSVNGPIAFTMAHYITPAAGSHSFTLWMLNASTGSTTLSANMVHTLFVMEHKR